MAVNGNDKVYWSKKLPKYHLTEFSSSLITFFIFRMKMVHLVLFFFQICLLIFQMSYWFNLISIASLISFTQLENLFGLLWWSSG